MKECDFQQEMGPVRVAVLGATGVVGQKLICLLAAERGLNVAELSASKERSGEKYVDACTWGEAVPMPEPTRKMRLKAPSEITAPFVLSAVPADVARGIERSLAERGHWVISNASAHRMRSDVPLVIPEVNVDHLGLLDTQTTKGRILTNPNCCAICIALALRPLIQLGMVQHVSVVTLQAISGAGYRGVFAYDILGNVIPNIEGEGEKIEGELLKIFGDTATPARFQVAVHTNRVPVLHGHTAVLHIHFVEKIAQRDVESAFFEAMREFPDAYVLHTDPLSPQPRRDLDNMDNRVHIGQIKVKSGGRVVGLTAMGHNLVRGAAGAALLNLKASLRYRRRVL